MAVPRPRGRGSAAGRKFLGPSYTTANAQCLRLSERFFSLLHGFEAVTLSGTNAPFPDAFVERVTRNILVMANKEEYRNCFGPHTVRLADGLLNIQ